MSSFAYHRPRTLEEAWRVKESAPEDARFVAGGTDLLVNMRRREESPPALISLRSVPELEGIETGPGGARIGAMTLVGDIVSHPGLGERYPVLVEAAKTLGSPQIRNSATIGGNLCRAAPCADMAPPLLVLEAKARLRRPGGVREVALDEFILGPAQTCLEPGELLTDILLDPPAAGTRALFLKQGRVKMDLSLASVAVLVVMEKGRCHKARVAAGAVAPTPLRLREVEALVEGSAITPKLLAEARRAAERGVAPITDLRASEAYRRRIVGVFVQRALEALA